MKDYQFKFIEKVASLFPQYGIDFGVNEFIACQFALESAFGKSKLARNNNNFCGMRSPRLRITMDVYPCSSWAEYDSLDDCVLDYVLWLTWNHFTCYECHNVDKYIIHLEKSGYCPEKDYINKIKSIYNLFNSNRHE